MLTILGKGKDFRKMKAMLLPNRRISANLIPKQAFYNHLESQENSSMSFGGSRKVEFTFGQGRLPATLGWKIPGQRISEHSFSPGSRKPLFFALNMEEKGGPQ